MAMVMFVVMRVVVILLCAIRGYCSAHHDECKQHEYFFHVEKCCLVASEVYECGNIHIHGLKNFGVRDTTQYAIHGYGSRKEISNQTVEP